MCYDKRIQEISDRLHEIEYEMDNPVHYRTTLEDLRQEQARLFQELKDLEY